MKRIGKGHGCVETGRECKKCVGMLHGTRTKTERSKNGNKTKKNYGTMICGVRYNEQKKWKGKH
jgi:hypothetical protein